MKQKIIFYTTTILVIQSAIIHAPAVIAKSPKGNSHFESHEQDILNHHTRATEINTQQKGIAPVGAKITSINQPEYNPIHTQEKNVSNQPNSASKRDSNTQEIDFNSTIESNQTPPPVPSFVPGMNDRSFLQAAKNMTANRFRSEDLYTQSGKDLAGNDITQIETRDPKTKTIENQRGDLISTKIIYKDGRYQIIDPYDHVTEELYADGTLEKNIRFDEIGNKISDIYEDSILGKTQKGIKFYNGQGPDYTIKDTSRLNKIIEQSKVDNLGNRTTVKYNNNRKIIYKEITTSTGNKTGYDAQGNIEITTPSGAKISVRTNGTITMQQKNNRVILPGNGKKPNITQDPINPGKTFISYGDRTVEIGQDASGKLIILEKNNRSQDKPPMIRSFQEDGTIYSSQKINGGLLEKFNDGPNIETKFDIQGNQLESIISYPQLNPLKSIIVTQKNFVLTITDSTLLGNPRTRVLDFSNYIEKLSSIGRGRSLRTAKTEQEQLDIINEMTQQLTGNQEIVKTPAYLEFRDQLRNQLDAPAAQANFNRNFFMRWINNLKIRVLSEHYQQLMTTKINIDTKRQSQNNDDIYSKTDRPFISPTQDSSIIAQLENNETIAIKDGNFILTSSDGTQVSINGKTGSISRSIFSNTKLTADKGKQIESINKDEQKIITTMQADGKTPASQMVYTGSGIEFYPADSNGIFTQEPTAQVTKNGNNVEIKINDTILQMNNGVITSQKGNRKVIAYNGTLTTMAIPTEASHLELPMAKIQKKEGTYAIPNSKKLGTTTQEEIIPTTQAYRI